MFNTSTIELSKTALKSNYNYIQKVIGKEVKLSSVVKGNAYGHGIEPFVKLSQVCGINHFSVYSADEALRVLTVANKNTNIMIMGWIDDDEIDWAIKKRIQFYVFDLERLRKTISISKRLKIPARIHIELETGMNRTGFSERRIGKLIELIKENKRNLIIEGICTHYAGAESISNYVRVHNQFEKFEKMYYDLTKKGIVPKYKHSASSAAAITYPNMRMDLVRIGILCYGFWPSPETFINHLTKKQSFEKDPLKRVLKWTSIVMSTKTVKMGEFIGYGNHYLAEHKTRIAVIPIGYSHGFSRSLSNNGKVLIKGKFAPVVGIVNMNLIIVDITHLNGVRRGDQVVIIGRQGKNEISVASFMQMVNQLNYELLSRLPESIPRIVKM